MICGGGNEWIQRKRDQGKSIESIMETQIITAAKRRGRGTIQKTAKRFSNPSQTQQTNPNDKCQ
jgi:hypothetical protein